MVKLNNILIKRLFLSVFYLISIIVLVMLVLPNLGLTISIWWLDNLLNLQIQWAFIALLLVLVNLVYIKKQRLRYNLIYFIMIVYNLFPLYVIPHKFTQQLLSATSNVSHYHLKHRMRLNIAQLNLSYNNPNINALLPILGNKKFDVLVIQEASDKEYENIKQLADYYPYSLGISGIEATPSGIAIFSRYQITEKNIYDQGYKSGHILEVLLQIPGAATPIQVYALHPGSPRTEKLWRLRDQTLTTIAQRISQSPFANKIVIGDFNSSPWSSGFINFKKTSQLKNSAQGFGYIPSWSYSQKPVLSLLSSVYIDHTFVSEPFEVINKQSQPIQGSDHQLLLTELAI